MGWSAARVKPRGGRSEVAKATPWPLGVVRPPTRAKKDLKFFWFGPWGWPNHPQGPWVVEATPLGSTRVAGHPPWVCRPP
jgi:hypothetical protein